MIDERISDDDLRRFLETAAATEPVPDDGVGQLLAARDRLEEPLRPRRPAWPALRKWAPATALALAVLTGGAVAVVNRPDSPPSSEYSFAAPSAVPSGVSGGHGSSGAASSGRNVAAPAPAAVPSGPPPRPAGAEPRIVQTGNLSLVVDDRETGEVVDRLGGVARGLGGYVAASSTQEGGGGGGGGATVTLRVPVTAFEQARAQVGDLGRVTRATTNAQDVTADYVDVTARITALQQTRSTYLTILGKASTIDETLAVQQQITAVQSQIEQLEGQQRVLADRSDLATLTVDVVDPDAASPATSSRSGFSAAWHQAVDGFSGGLQWLLAVSGPVALVVLLAAALFWPVRRLIRVLRRALI